MPDLLNTNELRLWASHCADKAELAIAARTERERLLKMRDSLLALAENADWLEGRSSYIAFQNAAE